LDFCFSRRGGRGIGRWSLHYRFGVVFSSIIRSRGGGVLNAHARVPLNLNQFERLLSSWCSMIMGAKEILAGLDPRSGRTLHRLAQCGVLNFSLHHRQNVPASKVVDNDPILSISKRLKLLPNPPILRHPATPIVSYHNSSHNAQVKKSKGLPPDAGDQEDARAKGETVRQHPRMHPAIPALLRLQRRQHAE
jgi:hypothetical protein